MTSPRQALADITKLKTMRISLDPDHPMNDFDVFDADEVRAILADVQPEPAPVGGTIDRDALIALLGLHLVDTDPTELADLVLALVRPVEGVALTPEEGRVLRDYLRDPVWPLDPSMRALAKRVEAAS